MWLDKEFADSNRHISKNIQNHRAELEKRIARNKRLAWMNKLLLVRHAANPDEVARLLSADSELLRQYRRHNATQRKLDTIR